MKKNKWPLTMLVLAGAVAASAASVANIESYGSFSREATGSRLEEFCSRYWGTMSSDLSLCRFEQTHYLSFHPSDSGSAHTGIPVLAGDLLEFDPSAGAVAIVGNTHYEGAPSPFTAGGEGYLSFRTSPGARLPNLKKVRQQRCFRQDGRAIRTSPCPA